MVSIRGTLRECPRDGWCGRAGLTVTSGPRRTAARTWASGGNHPYGSVRSTGEIPLRPGAGAVIYVVSDDVTVLEKT